MPLDGEHDAKQDAQISMIVLPLETRPSEEKQRRQDIGTAAAVPANPELISAPSGRTATPVLAKVPFPLAFPAGVAARFEERGGCRGADAKESMHCCGGGGRSGGCCSSCCSMSLSIPPKFALAQAFTAADDACLFETGNAVAPTNWKGVLQPSFPRPAEGERPLDLKADAQAQVAGF